MCIYANILDHHHVWRSLGSTLCIWSNLKEKKYGFNSLFFKAHPSKKVHPELSMKMKRGWF